MKKVLMYKSEKIKINNVKEYVKRICVNLVMLILSITLVSCGSKNIVSNVLETTT